MKIAIAGFGISGIASANYLCEKHEITVFESNHYLGGHTHTHDIELGGQKFAIDTGFIVFNKKTYPLFTELLDKTQTEYAPTSMSFSVSCERTGLEYNGTDFNGLFAQRANLLRPSFLTFLWGISDFNKKAKKFLNNKDHSLSLGDFFRQNNIKRSVIEYYVLPMMAAVWSTDPALVWNFPANFVLRFFENHGFLEIDDRPQWYVIKGGSKSYIPNFLKTFKGDIRTNSPIKSIKRENNKVYVTTENGVEEFDAIIMATHSDTSLKLLSDASHDERTILSELPYVKNPTYLHLDRSFLPKRERAWASWNYLLPNDNKKGATVTYNMNILQGIESKNLFNVTLNPHRSIKPETILKEINYNHPLFTLQGMEAQQSWKKISGVNNTFYCGAYWRNGFHEDGVFSAKRVADQIEGNQGSRDEK
ncbi:NAD(P)/FAD-dependent oxidoreductase [Halobacteriovorax marinus]|uniref:NAD(P)/FAD-dependent oxidoreductase n=1 Tax=Halobacteriovorax marinus TaxID=97084 RepID=UPI003A93D58E